MTFAPFNLTILLCSVALLMTFPGITRAFIMTSSSTTQFSSSHPSSGNGSPDVLPECAFDVPLDPKLVCKMMNPEALHYYQPGQKFCACPSFSECIDREVEHKITMKKELIFMCYKSPTYADKKHEDMTMGLLREDAL